MWFQLLEVVAEPDNLIETQDLSSINEGTKKALDWWRKECAILMKLKVNKHLLFSMYINILNQWICIWIGQGHFVQALNENKIRAIRNSCKIFRRFLMVILFTIKLSK